MITELKIKNFRCFKDHTIPIKDQTIIVGANNAGKSTVIEALRLLSLVVSRYGLVGFKEPPSWLELSSANRGMSPARGKSDFNTLSLFYNLGNPPAIITAKFDIGAEVNLYIGPEGQIFAVINDKNGNQIKYKDQALRMPLPILSVLPQVTPVSREEVILDKEYARKVTSSPWASLHFRNQLFLYPEFFEEFKELAERTWSDLKILPLDKEGNFPGDKLALLIQDKDFTAEISWMGHGLQVWLQTIWFLARYRDSATIVLDEPDVYMHADLQRKLIRLLNKRHSQTIIATHSVEIMSEVEANSILVVNRHSNISFFTTSVPAMQHVVDTIGGVHNLQLTRLWQSKRCILVEGKDLSFLKIVYDKVYPNSQESLESIPHLSVGGWSGWDYVAGSKLLLRNAIGEEIITYSLFDRDYHTIEQIFQRYNEAEKRDVDVHIWTKKEIENFFIVPDAIVRIISAENRKDVNPPSSSEVELIIDKFALEMEETVFDAIAFEYFNQDKSGGIKVANVKARSFLDRVWSTKEGRRSFVSGKTLISKLSEWAQVSYGVSISSTKLIREISRDEIDRELLWVVKAIHDTRSFEKFGLGRKLHLQVSD